MQTIYPEDIDGDLLELVHLPNDFKMVPGAKPLKVGDPCKAEARIVSAINSESGKTAEVEGNAVRNVEPVIKVSSSLLYRVFDLYFPWTSGLSKSPATPSTSSLRLISPSYRVRNGSSRMTPQSLVVEAKSTNAINPKLSFSLVR